MRVDRIEPTKNILRGFQAYAQMLDEHPELSGKVNFLAFLVPSRQGLAMYKRHNADVEKMIDEINEKYGTKKWTPITAFFGNDRTRSLAAMQYYDVLLVNPIIDGMILCRQRGTGCQCDKWRTCAVAHGWSVPAAWQSCRSNLTNRRGRNGPGTLHCPDNARRRATHQSSHGASSR